MGSTVLPRKPRARTDFSFLEGSPCGHRCRDVRAWGLGDPAGMSSNSLAVCLSWPCDAVTLGTVPFSAKRTLPRGPRGSSVQALFSLRIGLHTCVRGQHHKDTVQMTSVSKLLWEARAPEPRKRRACSLGGQSRVCLPGPGQQAGRQGRQRPAETSLVLANFCPHRRDWGRPDNVWDRVSKCSKSLAMTSTGGVPPPPCRRSLWAGAVPEVARVWVLAVTVG